MSSGKGYFFGNIKISEKSTLQRDILRDIMRLMISSEIQS
jgi:hypothetical protein